MEYQEFRGDDGKFYGCALADNRGLLIEVVGHDEVIHALAFERAEEIESLIAVAEQALTMVPEPATEVTVSLPASIVSALVEGELSTDDMAEILGLLHAELDKPVVLEEIATEAEFTIDVDEIVEGLLDAWKKVRS